VADTIAWVTAPNRWNDNKGDPGFSDQRLADVQFAASLAAALESGRVKNGVAINAAALRVARAQADDGSWPVDTANPAGSPATYGVALATYMAWDSLRRGSSSEISGAQRKAEEHLSAITPDNIPNAAVLLLFHGSRTKNPNLRDPSNVEVGLNLLRRAQASDGGWGPYVDSSPEAFDTALALLALAEFRNTDGAPAMIQRGRAYLTATQLADGSWSPTTRPSGGQSYAQQMSTTGWATLALLATR
jgi:hypothetical protein